MYSIYDDLPRCTACGACVEPWVEPLGSDVDGECARCQGEHDAKATHEVAHLE